MAPSFDVAQYAKESEARVRAKAHALASTERAVATHSEGRRPTRPGTGGVVVPDETWARGTIGAPTVTMVADQLKRLPLDNRAGFLLSLMDGAIDLDTVVELSAMPRAEALRVVRGLVDAGVVEFRSAR
ncbi:MAG: hypothetical protein M3O36_21510 [Myxococcota bacterium]|nr:hypothetical protein [Myxococcota bacterium]